MRALVPLVLLAGCDDLGSVLDFQVPEAHLKGVELVDAPPAVDLLGYGCAQALGEGACSVVGLDSPRKQDLSMSFDLVFDLENPNALPIPLVETLLGFTAFDQADLGTVCVRFCDPKDPDCDPKIDAPNACQVDESDPVAGPEDLIPTVDDLVTLAQDVSGGSFDNGDWRMIPAYGSTDAHLQFDIGVDPLLQIADDLLLQAVDQVFAGKSPTFDIPYTVEGTVFFDVPAIGRQAVGFGPLSDDWRLR